jgi:hypothetical protein
MDSPFTRSAKIAILPVTPSLMIPLLSLTTTAFANIPHSLRTDEFTFIIGDQHHQITCPTVVACFLSPAVSNRIQTDVTARTFLVSPNVNVELFKQFVKIGDGHQLAAKMIDDDAEELWKIAQLLQNTEFASIILATLCSTTKSETPPTIALTADAQIEFLAQHFYQFTEQNSKVSNLIDFNHFVAILSHPSFTIETEDALCDLILSRIEQDSIHFQLFKFFNFPVHSTDRLKQIWDLGPDVFQHGTVDFDLCIQNGTRMVLPLDKLSPQSYQLENCLLRHHPVTSSLRGAHLSPTAA